MCSFFEYNKHIMDEQITVVIPNRNGSATIARCLEAIFSSSYRTFDVVVVDDGSEDDSIMKIDQFPCRLIRLEEHSGASHARNVGAQSSSGEILFFTDADCLVNEDTLALVNRALQEVGPNVLIGGTYSPVPADPGFFSRFQSAYINYAETKHAENPDYLATHALALRVDTFKRIGGFREAFMPILEDVEFSHRARRAGHRLIMKPDILVRHLFNYTLSGSLRNAVKKSYFWTAYSLANRDLFRDSGTASTELKVNVGVFFASLFLVLVWLLTGHPSVLFAAPLLIIGNALVSRGLIRAFQRTKGTIFALSAYGYYALVYPLAVGAGAFGGAMKYFFTMKTRENRKNPKSQMTNPK